MSLPDTPPPVAPKKSPIVPAAEANGQLIVSLAIVIALALLGVAMIVAGCVAPAHQDLAWGGVGTILGALATALNAPSGVTSAVRAALAGKTPPA